MARHSQHLCGPWLVPVVRLATCITSEDYINGRAWERASLKRCPWHPRGGCGFARHGSYPRRHPAGARVPRWYCPTARCTVSALADCLASHRRGTLAECEATLRAIEQAPSFADACRTLRPEIELPGAERYLRRLRYQVHDALLRIKGLLPTLFADTAPTLAAFSQKLPTTDVLITLRDLPALQAYLQSLPTPLGFDPPRRSVRKISVPLQHTPGRDPPIVSLDPP